MGDDKHVEAAIDAVCAALGGRKSLKEFALPIAAAIAASYASGRKEGMAEAAQIAAEFEDEDILTGADVAEIIKNTILTEASTPAIHDQTEKVGA